MVLNVAFDTDKSVSFSASRSIIIKIKIILLGSNIPARICGIDVIGIGQGMKLLKAIGVFLYNHLITDRHSIHDKNIKELAESVRKLSLLSCNGLTHQYTDGHPIEKVEALYADVGHTMKSQRKVLFKRSSTKLREA